MLLGKRPRPPMKRTTSMTEITVDLGAIEVLQMSEKGTAAVETHHLAVAPEYGFDPRFLSMMSPRIHRRSSGDFVETAQFLRACGLCKRRLATGKDIYMYRGDTAFCSLECRQQQMNQDERKEKCSLASVKQEAVSATGSDSSNKGGETVAAA